MYDSLCCNIIMVYRVGVGIQPIHMYIQPEPVGDVGARPTPPPTVIKGRCYSRGSGRLLLLLARWKA